MKKRVYQPFFLAIMDKKVKTSHPMGLYFNPGNAGFADLIFLPKKAARRSILIMELKKDATPENAIRQIQARGYEKPYLDRGEDILFIGITYDSKDPEKPHRCAIQEYEAR